MEGKVLKRNLAVVAVLALPADLTMLAVQHFDRGGKIPPGVRKAINLAGVTFFNAGWLAVPLLKQPRLKGRWAKPARMAGLPLMFAGALLGGVSTWNRKIIGIETPDHLITSGVYAHMRHPTYAAVVAGSLGWAMFQGAPCAAAALPPLVLESVIAGLYEESVQLVPLFGEEFEEYRKKVPFFPPALTALFTAVYALALVMTGRRFLEERRD